MPILGFKPMGVLAASRSTNISVLTLRMASILEKISLISDFDKIFFELIGFKKT